jgi:hypothetical protein
MQGLVTCQEINGFHYYDFFDFLGMHFNPEVTKMGNIILIYIGTGLF